MTRLNLFNGTEQHWFIDQANSLAERTRLRYITPGEGQAAAYREKHGEAVRLDAGEGGPFPHIEAEAAALDVTQQSLATEIIRRHARWATVSARIEAERASCKTIIRAAGTPQTMRNALTLMRERMDALAERYPPGGV